LRRPVDSKKAASEYRAALAIEPANAKAHSNLGAALASLGRFDAAIDEFNAALKSEPRPDGCPQKPRFSQGTQAKEVAGSIPIL
jgi:tetratricopeptide (TPR) repeat protein